MCKIMALIALLAAAAADAAEDRVIARVGGFTLHFAGASVFATTADGQFQKEIDERDYAFLRAPFGI